MQRELSQPDPEGQAALQKSWYGRLLRVLYQIQADGTVLLREQIGPDDVRRVQALIQEVADHLVQAANSQRMNRDLLKALDLPAAGARVSISVFPDDSHRVLVSPNCDRASIELSVQAVREIVQTALKQGEVSELEAVAERWFFEMFHIDTSTKDVALSGSPVAALFGPARSKFLTKKIERQLSAQGTVVWKAIAFIVGHEAHHLWSKRCNRQTDNMIQQKAEIQADVLGTILAVTAYNRRCGRELIASKEDAHAMLNEKQSLPAYPREVVLQMALIPSPELLVGASGVSTLQKALGPLFDADPSHPAAGERLAIDERGASSLASKLFGQPLRGSWTVSLISRLAGATKEEMIEYAYRDLEFAPNYRIVDGFLLCAEIQFATRADRRGSF